MVYSEHFALPLSACWSGIMRIMAKTGNIELEVTASPSQSPLCSPLMEIVRLVLSRILTPRLGAPAPT